MEKKITKTEAEWKKELPEEIYSICRLGRTEAVFTGKYYMHKGNGIYLCICCGNELFLSNHKYDSGSGWPSFYQIAKETAIELKEDKSYGMERIEVVCKKCSSHLGHLFPDGPEPTGLRYCINSAALDFKRKVN